MEDKEEKSDTWVIMLLITIPAIMGFLLGVWLVEHNYRKQAVENGAAKWVVTDSSGRVQFEWIKK